MVGHLRASAGGSVKVRTRRTRPIALAIDTNALALKIGEDMQRWWIDNYSAGRQPDGTARPRNKKGQPLGGSGSLAREWLKMRAITRSKLATSVCSRPPGGKRGVVVSRMLARGVQFQGLSGASATKWRAVVEQHAKAAMADALGKRRR